MLHSRLRPLPRRHQPQHPSSTAPPPDLHDEDDPDVDEPEDLFTAFLPHLFPDDAPSFHGDPGQRLLYSSPRYGDLEIMVPSYPGQSEKRTEEIAAGQKEEGRNEVDEGRKLFAHFLWSAAMVVAEGVEWDDDDGDADTDVDNINREREHKGMWRVKGERVLELGAGAALPSLISALAHASSVTITDHPSSPAFAGAIDYNIAANIPADLRPRISAEPHEWGVLDTPWAVENKGRFTRIIAADCLWMRSQHENLVKTFLWFLPPVSEDGDGEGRVWIVAGFHTGRAIVAGFFETAVRMGMVIERIYERDLNSGGDDGREVRREWTPVREGEGPENRKRWCVIAVLKRGR